MDEYLLNVDADLYGPYHSEEQAMFARHVFISKHPDMQDKCFISPIDTPVKYNYLFEPQLLY